jgi:hypothetical protein
MIQMSQRKSGTPRFFSFGHLRKQLFQLPIEEATFARRGFRGADKRARQRLELIGATFLLGYHAALEESDLSVLTQRLNSVDAELRGFAFEGAAMGLALVDLLTPWKKKDRWHLFLKKGAAPHQYMMHVGAGWALARLPWFETHPALIDPLLGWLVIDGYGFHRGYFQWPRYVVEQKLPKRLSPNANRVFDQGLGRSLWFVEGADVNRIPATIAAFDPARQPDLWSGTGLACTYAGGVDAAAIKTLQTAAGPYRPQLAQGAAFAAKTRQRAGNPVEHTDLACRILCDCSADAAAAITDEALKDLPINEAKPAYQVWRERIQNAFAGNAL